MRHTYQTYYLFPDMHVLIGLVLIMVSTSSCNLDSLEAEIPSYVHLQELTLSTNASREGSASTNITEGWIFIDDEFYGAFSVPSTVPVPANIGTTIRLEAGIRDNGVSSTPDIYPFYAPISRSIDLVPNNTDTLDNSLRYRSNTAFPLIENYETGLTVFQEVITGTSANRLRPAREAAFEGEFGGLIELTKDAPVAELASIRRFRDLQDGGIPVYLEMDFRSEAPVQFGVVAYNTGSEIPLEIKYVAGFNPSEEWKKIYFNLSAAIANSEGDEFELILQTTLPTQTDGTLTRNAAKIRIDNFKLVHFE
ncbi:MAG: hypothetical protein HRU40_13645 [Saprospiraceae bacterium]|nr:hypothetical protein [Saprospiraceae bacterium]